MTMMIIILMIMMTATMLCMVWQAGVTKVWSLVERLLPFPTLGPTTLLRSQMWDLPVLTALPYLFSFTNLTNTESETHPNNKLTWSQIWEVTRCLLGMVIWVIWKTSQSRHLASFMMAEHLFLNLHSAHATMSQQSPNFSISATESNSISTILNTPRSNHEKGVSEQGWW